MSEAGDETSPGQVVMGGAAFDAPSSGALTVNGGVASRAEWATDILARMRHGVLDGALGAHAVFFNVRRTVW